MVDQSAHESAYHAMPVGHIRWQLLVATLLVASVDPVTS